ncbi:transcriptional regulator [Klebsiella pneumoniae]|nr:transcriptional regulator [Klebsiella pneumoniae]
MTFNSYIINDEVIFNMDVNELQPVAGKDHEAITLNNPHSPMFTTTFRK